MERPMGPVTTEATIENLQDVFDMERGALPHDQVRRVELTVDADESLLSIPISLIRQLGLTKDQQVKSSAAPTRRKRTSMEWFD
jgi:hypothetical protein